MIPRPAVVVPYDPATGFALPEASVGTTTVTENQAIIEAEVFRYVSDREVYNQLDNDVRVRSVLSGSEVYCAALMARPKPLCAKSGTAPMRTTRRRFMARADGWMSKS